ncbi:uncharacterized protein LOC131248485 [Magnolia sinica]|uniref:uncharacterized protein LOC131248485 n=1 Tax=Magnolia sinica TaxID=86752 RepID=UPI00265B0F8D|nr:uncharacterized protein LOC131248485 [Magnolia sinica]XP_058104751.1 uncharacterized protein LOC131248485 [Magnolia sinica]
MFPSLSVSDPKKGGSRNDALPTRARPPYPRTPSLSLSECEGFDCRFGGFGVNYNIPWWPFDDGLASVASRDRFWIVECFRGNYPYSGKAKSIKIRNCGFCLSKLYSYVIFTHGCPKGISGAKSVCDLTLFLIIWKLWIKEVVGWCNGNFTLLLVLEVIEDVSCVLPYNWLLHSWFSPPNGPV